MTLPLLYKYICTSIYSHFFLVSLSLLMFIFLSFSFFFFFLTLLICFLFICLLSSPSSPNPPLLSFLSSNLLLLSPLCSSDRALRVASSYRRPPFFHLSAPLVSPLPPPSPLVILLWLLLTLTSSQLFSLCFFPIIPLWLLFFLTSPQLLFFSFMLYDHSFLLPHHPISPLHRSPLLSSSPAPPVHHVYNSVAQSHCTFCTLLALHNLSLT